MVASVSSSTTTNNDNVYTKQNLFEGLHVAEDRVPTRVASSPSRFSNHTDGGGGGGGHTPRFYGLDNAASEETTNKDDHWQLWEIAYVVFIISLENVEYH